MWPNRKQHTQFSVADFEYLQSWECVVEGKPHFKLFSAFMGYTEARPLFMSCFLSEVFLPRRVRQVLTFSHSDASVRLHACSFLCLFVLVPFFGEWVLFNKKEKFRDTNQAAVCLHYTHKWTNITVQHPETKGSPLKAIIFDYKIYSVSSG